VQEAAAKDRKRVRIRRLPKVVGRMGKGRSGAKVPKKARERERGGSL